jgi:hypothetical protein
MIDQYTSVSLLNVVKRSITGGHWSISNTVFAADSDRRRRVGWLTAQSCFPKRCNGLCD